MKLLRDPLQPVDLVLMQKLSPFYPVCLPVASSYAVCLRFTCWSTRHGHVLSWPPKPPHTRTSFCFFCSVHSLTSHLRSKGSNCSTAFKKKKTFQDALPVSSLTPPQKQNVLFSYSLHALLFSAGTQMIVAFSCVWTASSTHSIEWADCPTLSMHSWSPTAACSQSKDVQVSSTSDTFKSQAFIFIGTNWNYFLLHKYNIKTFYHSVIYICYISNALCALM